MYELNLRVGWFLLFIAFIGLAFYMTGYYFSPNLTLTFDNKWTDIAQTVIQAFGLLSLFFFWLDRINNDRWSRLREALNLTWTTPYAKLLQEIRQLEDKKVICRTWQPITEEELIRLENSNGAKLCIRNFLDHLEEIAAGQKLKVFDERFFESVWSSILKKNFRYFEPLIVKLRLELGQPDLYYDLKEVVEYFEKKELRKKKLNNTGLNAG
jgi:hypothetical protein